MTGMEWISLFLMLAIGVRIRVRWRRDAVDTMPQPIRHCTCEPASQQLLTAMFVRRRHPAAATRTRAALWVHLVCEDIWIYDRRRSAEPVTDPLEQWRLVYEGTQLESLN